MKNYKEYIFSLIAVEENLIILNKNENLFNFLNRCKSKYSTVEVINLFNKETLEIYDNVTRIIANIIFERIPRAEGVDLDAIPDFDEFLQWFGTLKELDWYMILYYFFTRGYIELGDDENLQYLLNVYETAKVSSNGQN